VSLGGRGLPGLLLGLVLAAACQTTPARPLRAHEVRAAGSALAKSLDSLTVEGMPLLRVVGSVDDPLVDEARQRAMACGKFTVSDSRERKPEYALCPETVEERTASGPVTKVTFELFQVATNRRVLVATWSGSN